MFSGIIKNVGTITRATKRAGGVEYEIAPKSRHSSQERRRTNADEIHVSLRRSWKIGESVLIAGICSTVIKKTTQTITVFHMPETLVKTTSASWQKGTRVNIEPSLRVGEDISGHVVSGHVDGTARVSVIKKEGECQRVTFVLSKNLARYMIAKGSVAVDGVSLTVVDVKQTSFSAALIPYTLGHTTLGQLKRGDRVNIEVDQVAKYIEKYLALLPSEKIRKPC